jgi:predicted amidohydrolase
MTGTTVAAVQMCARPKDVECNLAKAEWYLEEAADKGAKLVVFPELFNVGYYIGPDLFALWETEDGRTVTWMRERAAAYGAVVAGSIPERRGTRLLNTLFIAEPDGRLHRYSKRQPTKWELAAFDPGDDESIVQTSLGRIGRVVCADMLWGRSLLKPMAGRIDLLLQTQASSTFELLGKLQWWHEKRQGLARRPLARAIGAPVVSAGMIGSMQPVTRLFPVSMFGGTYVIDAHGRTQAVVPFYEEGLAIADVVLGSTGGEPQAKVFKDPGLGRDLIDCLVRDLPNLRPRQARRSEAGVAGAAGVAGRQKVLS